MHDEAGFLSAIRETPADDTARLVFADWLDEQDNPACQTKAAFIRLELRAAESNEKGSNRVRLRRQIQKLAAQIEPTWLAVVSHPKLDGCRRAFQLACPKQWERLIPTGTPNIRRCESCNQNVHYCATLEEAQNHAANGTCVALSLALIRRPHEFPPPRPPRPRFLALPRRGRFLPHRMRPGTPRPAAPPVSPPSGLPETEPEEPPVSESGRQPRSFRRQKGRHRNRNVQHDNWEEEMIEQWWG